MSFKAVLLNKDQQGFSARVTELEDEDLPAGSEVLISVEYSTLNYKDALVLLCHKLSFAFSLPQHGHWPRLAINRWLSSSRSVVIECRTCR